MQKTFLLATSHSPDAKSRYFGDIVMNLSKCIVYGDSTRNGLRTARIDACPLLLSSGSAGVVRFIGPADVARMRGEMKSTAHPDVNFSNINYF
ncbi:hypothetical protein [Syntrophobacter fumaroxidans]|uniref:Uncharacterized protein n=1 Tax=Syntrophobacter fumaroxidans (strain DSM 10017 / MPOB) TaxID=335543 RepID=A0LKH9_SYNFM|nr:hypothetical protein [Syntrophobacter fumaroxidans]ABK17931.1 hypothetical protein Sfum_2249 [Syntrophobacter fumaroxidans MPOB]